MNHKLSDNAEDFTSCTVGKGFSGKSSDLHYSGVIDDSAVKLLYSAGIGYRYPPLSARQPTPVSLSLSCNRTVYETSHALDVLWSYSADNAMEYNETLDMEKGANLLGSGGT